ncbi:MAG: Spy/CpxP family protein refolding chaperone [Elusimicrobia bacterium]|nr:Spy/CpxP family protein refolding chaperone [Elusimicrobiota bacterium]
MKRFLGLLVGFLMLGTGFVFAEMPCEKGTGQGKEMKHEMGRVGERDEDVGNVKKYLNCRQELNLTDEQVRVLEKIRNDFRRDAIKRQADMKLVRMDLQETMRQEKPDFAAAKAKIKQISELQFVSKIAMIDAMEKGYNTLTKEQQDKLPQLKKERRENWKKNKMGEKK